MSARHRRAGRVRRARRTRRKAYPWINGQVYSWSSLELNIDGMRISDLSAIEYGTEYLRSLND